MLDASLRTSSPTGRWARASVLPAIVLASTLLAPGRAAAQRYIAGADTVHQRIIYADSLTSLNDRCAVRQTRMALMRKPVYVNGRPVGFC
jgi:hypothetical protein